MAINVPGVMSMIFFYIVIMGTSILAGRRSKTAGDFEENHQPLGLMLAGRNMGIFLGIFSMTATWVCGGYINGIAEVLYTRGLIWCQAPFGFAISLIIGGQLFAVKMRDAGYKTMLDPFQKHYGVWMGCLLFIPALCGEILWSSAILTALGGSVQVALDIEEIHSVIVSACLALFYTLSGGVYSVAYLDCMQLAVTCVGLWLCVPFMMSNRAVGKPSYPSSDYIGSFDSKHFASYWDRMLSLMMGRVPWQAFFQRVLSSKSSEDAELLSYMASLGCFLMAVPPIVIGAVARVANFTALGYLGRTPLAAEDAALILPLSLRYLPPPYVSAIGFGAVSAAVMSSLDSSVLSTSSMFAWNVYKLALRQSASENEVIFAMRLCVVLVGVLAALIAISVKSVYYLCHLSSDLAYVVLFPQLVSVVYLKEHCNAYGAVIAYLVGIVFRAAGGEPSLGIPMTLMFPFYSPKEGQLFPFRTFCMIASFTILISMSMVFKAIFDRLPAKYDIWNCFEEERKAEASRCLGAEKRKEKNQRSSSVAPRRQDSDPGKLEGTGSDALKERRKSRAGSLSGAFPVYESVMEVKRSPSESERMRKERRRSSAAASKSRKMSRVSPWDGYFTAGPFSGGNRSKASRDSVHEAALPFQSNFESQAALEKRRRSSIPALRDKNSLRRASRPQDSSSTVGTASDTQQAPGPAGLDALKSQRKSIATSRGSLPLCEATVPVRSTSKSRHSSSAATKSRRNHQRGTQEPSTTGTSSSAEGPPGTAAQAARRNRTSVPGASRASIPNYEATLPLTRKSLDEGF